MSAPLFDFMHLIDALTFTDTGCPLFLYRVRSLGDRRLVIFDDLELGFKEILQGDELAQSIFLLTGGQRQSRHFQHGETENFLVFYEHNMPSHLGIAFRK